MDFNIMPTLLSMSISASVFIVAILLMRLALGRYLPRTTFLVLWGFVSLKLFVPFTIPFKLSIFTLINNFIAKSNISKETTIPLTGSVTNFEQNKAVFTMLTNSQTTVEPEIYISPLLVVWVIGIVLCLLSFLITHLQFRKRYRTAIPIENDFIAEWINRNNTICRKIRVCQSDMIATPLTYGIIYPVILLPKALDYNDQKTLELILMHEYSHIKRFDVLKKYLLMIAVCVHWFNPLVWVMYMLANRDIELMCDQTVVRGFKQDVRADYAMALVSLKEKISGLSPMANGFNKSFIEERIVSIMKIKKIFRTSIVSIALAVLVVITTSAVFATQAVSKLDEKPIPASSNSDATSSNNNAVDDKQVVSEPTDLDNQSQPTSSDVVSSGSGKMSFIEPLKGKFYISSPFGNRSRGSSDVIHTGMDLGAEYGTDIYAIADGEVIFSEWAESDGLLIKIKHNEVDANDDTVDGEIITWYAHCSKLIGREGDIVKQGDVIAKVGSTGRSTGNHLHFAVEQDGVKINPTDLFGEDFCKGKLDNLFGEDK